MKNTALKKFYERLIKLRDEILKVIDWKDNTTDRGDGKDEIDQANELIEREMGYWMSTNMRSNLQQVEEALERYNKGKYGKCLHCSCDIPEQRLEIIPFAKYCVPCQEKLEHRGR